jgi:hypothetical protein
MSSLEFQRGLFDALCPSKEGIVYFVQPANLLGTDRYKIGCSASNTVGRLSNYGANARTLRTASCFHPLKVEKLLLARFTSAFHLCAGQEWFEGSEVAMLEAFDSVIKTHCVAGSAGFPDPPLDSPEDSKTELKTPQTMLDALLTEYADGQSAAEKAKEIIKIHTKLQATIKTLYKEQGITSYAVDSPQGLIRLKYKVSHATRVDVANLPIDIKEKYAMSSEIWRESLERF